MSYSGEELAICLCLEQALAEDTTQIQACKPFKAQAELPHTHTTYDEWRSLGHECPARDFELLAASYQQGNQAPLLPLEPFWACSYSICTQHFSLPHALYPIRNLCDEVASQVPQTVELAVGYSHLQPTERAIYYLRCSRQRRNQLPDQAWQLLPCYPASSPDPLETAVSDYGVSNLLERLELSITFNCNGQLGDSFSSYQINPW